MNYEVLIPLDKTVDDINNLKLEFLIKVQVELPAIEPFVETSHLVVWIRNNDSALRLSIL